MSDELANYKHQSSDTEDKKLQLQALSLYGGASYLYPYLRPEMRILDVGCGPGTLTIEMWRKAKAGTVVGIDANERSIALNNANPEYRKAAGLSFQVGKARSIGFSENSFDLTHCRFVLMHNSEATKVLSEMVRVTKPGGLVVAHESVQDVIFLRPKMKHFDHVIAEWNKDCRESGLDPSIGLSLFSMFNAFPLEQVEIKNILSYATAESADFGNYIEMYGLEFQGLRESLRHRIEDKVFDSAIRELESLPKHSSFWELTVVASGRKPQ